MKRKAWKRIALCIGAVTLAVSWYMGYRAVNARYWDLLPHYTTVTYDLGEAVPLGKEIRTDSKGLEGYLYRVNSWELADREAYLREHQLENIFPEDAVLPERLMLVSVTIINDNNGGTPFSVNKLLLKGKFSSSRAYLNTALYGALNVHEEGSTVSPALSEETTIVLPFEIFKNQYAGSTWRNMEQAGFYITTSGTNTAMENRIVPLV